MAMMSIKGCDAIQILREDVAKNIDVYFVVSESKLMAANNYDFFVQDYYIGGTLAKAAKINASILDYDKHGRIMLLNFENECCTNILIDKMDWLKHLDNLKRNIRTQYIA